MQNSQICKSSSGSGSAFRSDHYISAGQIIIGKFGASTRSTALRLFLVTEIISARDNLEIDYVELILASCGKPLKSRMLRELLVTPS